MSSQRVENVEGLLRSSGLSVQQLYGVWEQRQPIPDPQASKKDGKDGVAGPQVPWVHEVRVARLFTEKALEKEEFLLVCDAAKEALRLEQTASEDERTELVRVRRHYAEAMMRLGFTRDARNRLARCLEDDFQPKLGRVMRTDILLQLGDILREESYYATTRAIRLQTAEDALGFYQQALQLDPQRLDAMVWTAAGSLVVSELHQPLREQAQKIARDILSLTKTMEDTEGPRVNTTRARAVAQVVLGDTAAAKDSYAQLQKLDNVTTAQLAEARFRARTLAEAIGQPPDFFNDAFPPLQLIVFAGHLPDKKGDPLRFPLNKVDEVRALLREKLSEIQARFGMVSAAAGGDLLFIEAMMERKAKFQVVLPWAREEFRRTSIDPYEPPDGPPIWGPLFDRALEKATTVREISQIYEPGESEVGWKFLLEVNTGMALSAARTLRLDVQPLALWDGAGARGAGGTHSFVSFWSDHLCQMPIIVDLPKAVETSKSRRVPASETRSEQSTLHQEVKSMLFGDIVGYSKLREQVMPEFVEVFLSKVSQLAATSRHAPRYLNTWGDAVYAVFDFAYDAGCFALDLAEMIKDGKDEWIKRKLFWKEPASGDNSEPKIHPLSIRMSLHTGPVFMHYNPVVRQIGFTGSHVSFAARIEPVTTPGEVFASEEFAAISELSAEIKRRRADPKAAKGDGAIEGGFFCDFAGTMQLAKGYPGRYRIYRLLPKKIFVTEEVARVVHESYIREARARGETPESNTALRPWEELPQDMREANFAQLADIPNKLRFLGYELAPAHGVSAREITMSDEQLEKLSMREHDRWMNDRLRHGWRYGPERDNARKLHNLLVPWSDISEMQREKDRDVVRNLPFLIERANFRVRKISDA